LILLDVMMPGLNGFEVLDILRANPKTRNIKVIMLTALTQVEDKVRAFAAGACDYIGKPCETAELLARVELQLNLKRTEAALRESEERYRDLFENASDLIQSVAIDGTFTYVNRAWREALGYTEDEVPRLSIFDIIHPDSQAHCRELFQRVVAGEDITIAEIRFVTKHGLKIEVEGSVSCLFENGKFVRTRGIFRDVTERKRMERELECYRNQLEEMVREKTANLVMVNQRLQREIAERKGTEKRVLQRNQELAALNAIAQTINQSVDLNEVLNNSLDKTLEILNVRHGGIGLLDSDAQCLASAVVRGIDDDLVQTLLPWKVGEGILGRTVQLGEPLFIESAIDSPHAHPQALGFAVSERLRSVMAVPLKANGKALGVVFALTEGNRVFTPEERNLLVTIGHQISTAIRKDQLFTQASRTQRLEELDRLRTALVACVSHELRTPLTSIKGLASTLTQSDVAWTPEDQREFLSIIDRQSDVLTRIVGDLIETSQLQAGIMKMEKGECFIPKLLDRLASQLHALTGKHRFEARVPIDLPPVHADEMRIGEIITNLVSNAAAYSDEGTRITLEAEAVDGHITLSVSDEGIGIPPEYIEKVFDQFFRLESGVARRKGGTGLGLSICKGIVKAHSGEIWVESEPGKGSVFRFKLPVMNGHGS